MPRLWTMRPSMASSPRPSAENQRYHVIPLVRPSPESALVKDHAIFYRPKAVTSGHFVQKSNASAFLYNGVTVTPLLGFVDGNLMLIRLGEYIINPALIHLLDAPGVETFTLSGPDAESFRRQLERLVVPVPRRKPADDSASGPPPRGRSEPL